MSHKGPEQAIERHFEEPEIYDVIIAYDVSGQNIRVKAALLERGYVDRITGEDGTIYYLPNTTLFKRGTNVISAKLDMLSVVLDVNTVQVLNGEDQISLEHFITTRCLPIEAISGTPHNP